VKRAAALLAFTALAGCSLEPTYVRPTPAVPAGWPAGDAYLRQSEATLPTVSYRDIFRDPRLQAIIDRALTNNQDVRIALANVQIARGQYRVQRSDLFPRIDGSAGVTTGETGNTNRNVPNVNTGGGRRTVYSTDVGLSSFEIDLFGRVRSLTKAALQEYLATEAGMRAARLTLVGEVASAYLTLATDRSLLAIAVDTETSASRSVELTRARLTGGIAPRSDLRQAETVLAQARSDHANQITAVAQDRNALELLVGAPVSDAELPDSIESIDGTLGEIPTGLDSRILLRRPDVVQAEYRLRAANARIGAARAAFFPTISLTAVAGFASTALSSLFSGGAFSWSVAPGATLPIFNAGANAGNLASARGENALALAQYTQAIQSAFRDVADALARRGTIDRQYAAQAELEAAARDNFLLAEARYREGIDAFLTSLDAQRTFYGARRSLAATRLTRADNLVTLYRALGGDMLVDTMPPPPTTNAAADTTNP
jgi:multidrug efflux system outer membrane protein